MKHKPHSKIDCFIGGNPPLDPCDVPEALETGENDAWSGASQQSYLMAPYVLPAPMVSCYHAAVMEDQAQQTAWLETTEGKRIPIEGNCSFGRSRSSTIVLPDDKVSRRHAMIHSEEDNVFLLIDLGSANGTYVNGRRVTQAFRLSQNDQIEIGDNHFQFHFPTPSGSWDLDNTTQQTIENVRLVHCWLLLADIESSTTIATNLPPEEGARVTGRWLEKCRKIIDSNSGAINKYLGDGLLAYWPDGSQGKMEVVATGLKEFKAFREVSELKFRIVLHYGPVSIRGGMTTNGEDSLYGKDLNFLFRMEKSAGSAGIPCMMSEQANKLLANYLPTTSCGSLAVASFEGEFPFFSF